MSRFFIFLITIFFSAAVFLFFSDTAVSACTLWSASGNEASGGTIISKNRDWKPGNFQETKLVHPKAGYAYFGLYATDEDDTGIKEGVNEKGLCVITAAADSVPKSKRQNQQGKSGKIVKILTSFANVDELLAKQDEIFSKAKASFFMIADANKIAVIEVGLDGKYKIKTEANGHLAHSNHYIEKDLNQFNYKIGKSSSTRFERISELLNKAKTPFTMEKFIEISGDQHDGPENSLWRTSPKKSTLSSWILTTPAKGSQHLRLVILNPDKKEQVVEYTLDDKFWKNGK